jgi:hypothetical protein
MNTAAAPGSDRAVVVGRGDGGTPGVVDDAVALVDHLPVVSVAVGHGVAVVDVAAHRM